MVSNGQQLVLFYLGLSIDNIITDNVLLLFVNVMISTNNRLIDKTKRSTSLS